MLSAPPSKPLEQARELRALCQGMDVVVLNLFPYDIVPVLALAAGCDSVKTLFANHSDHTFWIGASVAHSVVHLRKQSRPFLEHRRGLDPDRSSILPIPLACSPSPVSRVQAKRALGYDSDAVLLLTIASPFKYSSPGQTGFLDLVTPVLSEFPKAVLIAVGPEPKGAWRAAGIQTQGRIIPLGTRWDNDLYRAAADIYLDSVPFSSTTSLLESGSRGTPLLGYCSPNPALDLLGPGTPGLDGAMEVASDADSYRALLARLISDETYRHQSGQRVQNQILSLHTGSNWVHTVRDVYAAAERSTERGCLRKNIDAFDTSTLDVALVQLYDQMHGRTHASQRIGEYVGALPYYDRLSITRRLYLKGFGLAFVNLLPPPVDTIMRPIARLAKRIVRRLLPFHGDECLTTQKNEATTSPWPRNRTKSTSTSRKSTNMKKACMLAYTFYESDNRVRRYAETLAKQGYEVDAVSLGKGGQPRYERLNGVRICRIQKRARDEKSKLSYLYRLVKFFFNSALFVTKQHMQRRYDLIHVHSVPDFEVFATFFVKMTGARIILDIHDIVPELYASKFNVSKESTIFKALTWIEKASSVFADHVIIANHIWEKTLTSRSARKEKCTTILNYPDPSIFYKRPRVRKEGKFIIIYPGTINWHQGLDIAVKAFAQIKDETPEAEFHIYGDGPMRTTLQQLIVELGLQERVFLKGTLSLEKIAVAMAEADLAVVPKRNDSFGGDAFSTKILEFMALGIPVVAAATRIDRYYFNDSIIRFFEPENAEELASAIKELVRRRDMRERLALNAASFVSDYIWDKKEKDYLSLVGTLVENRVN